MARNLPLALMDLTLLRLSARNGARLVRHPAWRRPTAALPRQLHQNTSASFDDFMGHGLPAFDAELMYVRQLADVIVLTFFKERKATKCDRPFRLSRRWEGASPP